VQWSIFPFEGDLRVRRFKPPYPSDRPRSGEPGGAPCEACALPDHDYVWVDDLWRVRAARPSGVPAQLFLETRAHVDLGDLDDDLAGAMGRMVVRLDRAMSAIPGVGRVHVSRWGDGGAHFHVWFYARPVGASQMLGFCLPMWAMTLPPTADTVWQRNVDVVVDELLRGGGRAPMRERSAG
jgi:hypothetical protein